MYAREIREDEAGSHGSEWERCLEIRRRVFIDEQGVSEELELDGRETDCLHFLVFREPSDATALALGTARLWIDASGAAKAQRVAVLAEARRSGAGRALMREVENAARRRGHSKLLLGAQREAIPFYEQLGYRPFGDEFDDAGIPHRMMELVLAR